MNPFENIQYVKNDIRNQKLRIHNIQPIEDPTSECFECEAAMCHHQICPGDQYQWDSNDRNEYYYQQHLINRG